LFLFLLGNGPVPATRCGTSELLKSSALETRLEMRQRIFERPQLKDINNKINSKLSVGLLLLIFTDGSLEAKFLSKTANKLQKTCLY
jgi:hypothetical protein